MAEVVRASTGADVAQVWLHVRGEIRPVASSPSDTPMGAAIEADRRLPPFEGRRDLPVRDRGELLVHSPSRCPPPSRCRRTASSSSIDLASQAGLVLRNVRLIRGAQESRRRIVTAQDERARSSERDIHDGSAATARRALSVKLGLAGTARVARRGQDHRAARPSLKSDAAGALGERSGTSRAASTRPLLADHGLPARARGASSEGVDPRAPGPNGRVATPPRSGRGAYFCCLEALQNIAKYADATRRRRSGWGVRTATCTFEVEDDGRGFEQGTVSGSGPDEHARPRRGGGRDAPREARRRVRARRSAGAIPWGHREPAFGSAHRRRAVRARGLARRRLGRAHPGAAT